MQERSSGDPPFRVLRGNVFDLVGHPRQRHDAHRGTPLDRFLGHAVDHAARLVLRDREGARAAHLEKAGGTETAKVLEALPEVSVTGPRGVIKMDKQHHAALTMYLGQVQGDGSVKVVGTFKDVDPGEQCPKLK